jgi:glucokinase
MSTIYFAAVDIGGTKTAVGIFNQELEALSIKTFKTNAQKGCKELVRQCYTMTLDLCEQLNISFNELQSVGVASPGPLALKTGIIISIPTLGWVNEPLKQYFEDIFGLKTVVQNDTNAAALGEFVFGSEKGCDCLVYITVSTGVGCGIVIDGKIFDGSYSAAGELGHINIVKNGRLCDCKNRGCLEAYASGKSMANIASEILARPVTTKEVFELAYAGDNQMIDIIKFAGEALGYSISLIYQIIDPAVVILGGSVMKDFDMINPYIQLSAMRFIEHNESRNIHIVKSSFDGEQVLLGAAYLAKALL